MKPSLHHVVICFNFVAVAVAISVAVVISVGFSVVVVAAFLNVGIPVSGIDSKVLQRAIQ